MVNMKIAIHSDLHVEFHGKFPEVNPEADVIILAGDIIKTCDQVQRLLLVEFCREHSDKKVIWISGNHEAYSSDLDKSLQASKDLCSLVKADNLIHLENETYRLNDNVVIHGCTCGQGSTLWEKLGSR